MLYIMAAVVPGVISGPGVYGAVGLGVAAAGAEAGAEAA